jgi:hypothetical protein
MYSLGEYFSDGETLNLEFKEFFLKISPDIFYNENEIKEIIVSGKWNSQLNSLVIINVKCYINYYLGKYISCFCNSECDGEIIFGINDKSEITGIPYHGNIDILSIKTYIFDYISENVKGLDNINRISIEVEKLSRDIEFIEDDIYIKLKNLHKRKTKYDKIISKYIKDRKDWISKFKYYSRKFSELINDEEVKLGLIKFCKKNGADNLIIKTLENNEYIDLEYTENFYLRFEDPNDVIYWAGLYKDECVDKLKLQRPIKGDLPKLISYGQLLSKISLLRYRFLNNNPDLNYYLIRIRINGIGSKNVIQFKYPDCDDWISRSRVILDTGPGCI